MRPGCAADHSPPSSAAVVEVYSCTSTHPLGHTGPVMGTIYLLNPVVVCQSGILRLQVTFKYAFKTITIFLESLAINDSS